MPTDTTLRIAMWSGPRNISTALMRSFGARADTHVSDEPLYAHYLARTGLPHPMAAEIIAAGEPDWRRVAAELTGPVPGGRPVWYQKHMAHHLTEDVDRGWLGELAHAFLIREPRRMLTSLLAKLDQPVRAEDTGLPQQVELFRWIEANGATGASGANPPPVVDSRDVQDRPGEVLSALCEALGLAFDSAMLSWEPGPRDTDGCWGPHWYANTLRSTGFTPHRPPVGDEGAVPPEYEDLALQLEDLYAELRQHALGAAD